MFKRKTEIGTDQIEGLSNSQKCHVRGI